MKATFVTREFGKTGAEVSKEEFVKMMLEDIATASEEYFKWTASEGNLKYIEDCEAYAIRRQQAIERIIENSYAKYKKEYYRLRWVEKMSSSYPEEMSRDSWRHDGHNLKSIRWDIKPWDNACSRFSLDTDLEKILGYHYEEAMNNKYFKGCTGWSIVETDYSTEVKLHLSDELQEQWKADEHHLAESIAKFYEGCTYWGD